MIRPTVRRLSVLAVILALIVVVATPVAAQPPLPQKSTPSEEPGWLDTVLSFVSGLLPKALTLPELPPLPLFDPNTGSCIDPLGNPCVYIPGM
jgi:ABC-type transport system substrate-binding protein